MSPGPLAHPSNLASGGKCGHRPEQPHCSVEGAGAGLCLPSGLSTALKLGKKVTR